MVNGQSASTNHKSSHLVNGDQKGDVLVSSGQCSRQILSVLADLQVQPQIVNFPYLGEGANQIAIRTQDDGILRAVILALRNRGYTLVAVEQQFTNCQLTFAYQDQGIVTFEAVTILPHANRNKVEPISASRRPHAAHGPGRNGPKPGSSSGLFLIILGPDGVGKSTLARQITESFTPLFKRSGIFHWRPGVIRRSNPNKPLGQPHSLPARGSVSSLLYLLMSFVDCWLGYLSVERKILKAPGLIVFDRYLHDAMVDPFRYRYGGPPWVCSTLCSLVPPKDVLTLVLDAHESIVFSRKQELSLDQLQDQRVRYLNFAQTFKGAVLIDASQGIDQTTAAVFRAIVKYLERRVGPELDKMLPSESPVSAGA
jgi:thymidylate kinase